MQNAKLPSGLFLVWSQAQPNFELSSSAA